MPLTSLGNLRIVKVLADNPFNKSINVHAKFNDKDGDVILLLSKPPFSMQVLQNIISDDSQVQVQLENDIYSQYMITPRAEFNQLKSTLIYPATAKHLSKYSDHVPYIIEETPDDYKNITLPVIQENAFSANWVDGILTHRCESENIIYEDPDPNIGFILLPDLKWDKKQVNDLYLVAICHRHGLHSLRDLTASELPLLINIRDKGIAAIQKTYAVERSQLRIYIHYQPSYYHLHVHFTHLQYDTPGSTVGKAHLLQDVIENLQFYPDYYSRRTLSFIIKENDPLLQKYKNCGRFQMPS